MNKIKLYIIKISKYDNYNKIIYFSSIDQIKNFIIKNIKNDSDDYEIKFNDVENNIILTINGRNDKMMYGYYFYKYNEYDKIKNIIKDKMNKIEYELKDKWGMEYYDSLETIPIFNQIIKSENINKNVEKLYVVSDEFSDNDLYQTYLNIRGRKTPTIIKNPSYVNQINYY